MPTATGDRSKETRPRVEAAGACRAESPHGHGEVKRAARDSQSLPLSADIGLTMQMHAGGCFATRRGASELCPKMQPKTACPRRPHEKSGDNAAYSTASAARRNIG